MTLHTDGDKLTAPLRQDHDGNPILSIGEYRQHLIRDHGYTSDDFLPPERPDNLAQWRALDAKHEAARRSPCYSAEEAKARTSVSLQETAAALAGRSVGDQRVADLMAGAVEINADSLFPLLPEDGSEVRISMEPDPDGTPTLDVEEQATPEGEPTSVLLGAARILSWYALPITGIIVQAITARRHPELRGWFLFAAGAGILHTAARTIELHNSWQNRQATR